MPFNSGKLTYMSDFFSDANMPIHILFIFINYKIEESFKLSDMLLNIKKHNLSLRLWNPKGLWDIIMFSV